MTEAVFFATAPIFLGLATDQPTKERLFDLVIAPQFFPGQWSGLCALTDPDPFFKLTPRRSAIRNNKKFSPVFTSGFAPPTG